jgi:hypothetical protein
MSELSDRILVKNGFCGFNVSAPNFPPSRIQHLISPQLYDERISQIDSAVNSICISNCLWVPYFAFIATIVIWLLCIGGLVMSRGNIAIYVIPTAFGVLAVSIFITCLINSLSASAIRDELTSLFAEFNSKDQNVKWDHFASTLWRPTYVGNNDCQYGHRNSGWSFRPYRVTEIVIRPSTYGSSAHSVLPGQTQLFHPYAPIYPSMPPAYSIEMN